MGMKHKFRGLRQKNPKPIRFKDIPSGMKTVPPTQGTPESLTPSQHLAISSLSVG